MDAQNLGASTVMSPQTVKAVKEAPLIKCECGSATFTNAVIFKKISGMYFGASEPVLYPIPVYVCTKCGKIMSDMTKDKDLRELINDESVMGSEDAAEETPKEANKLILS